MRTALTSLFSNEFTSLRYNNLTMLRTYNKDSNSDKALEGIELNRLINKHQFNKNVFLKIYDKSNLICEKTYENFIDDSLKALAYLQVKAQVPPKSNIAIIADNSYETMVLYMAILFNECTIVPINPDESESYIKNIFSISKAKLLISREKKNFLDINIHSFNDLISFQGEAKKAYNPALDHNACIFFTSGTTGNPKGVVLSLKNIFINTIATIKEHNLTEKSVHFSCLPLCHVNAFSFSFFTNFFWGSRFIYQKYFFPLSYWNIIKEEKVEIVSSTPHIINLLNMDKRDFTRSEFPDLKYFVSASAPLSKEDVKNFFNKYNTRINQAYGLSETVNFTLTIPNDLDDRLYQKVMIDSDIPSAGCPIFGNNVEILSPSGEVLGENQTGEIGIRGWNVFQEYFENPNQTNIAFKNDFFHSGDTGYFKIIDGFKFIYINGRIKEVAKRKGLLCYLSEVDLELKTFFKDINFCSCCFKNEYTGEEIGLVVEDLSSINIEELKAKLLNFPAHKRPKVLLEAPVIMTSTKKPMRSKMSSLFDSYLKTRIKDQDLLI